MRRPGAVARTPLASYLRGGFSPLEGSRRARRPPSNHPGSLTFWKKLFGGDDRGRVDYYQEGVGLLEAGNFHEALTSFRLALKESPGDRVILQQIAICYTRIGMTDEAAKTYKHVLQKEPTAAGAHYGLAFLLLKGGDGDAAAQHLEAFLANAPSDAAVFGHVDHARQALARLRGEAHDAPQEPPPPDELF